MTCAHLRQLEAELIRLGYRVTYRGKPWTANCREGVYFDCYIEKANVRQRVPLAECIVDHEHLGTHDGQEAGFYCSECHDAIMGVHPKYVSEKTPIFV
jgi:hypothetical protein